MKPKTDHSVFDHYCNDSAPSKPWPPTWEEHVAAKKAAAEKKKADKLKKLEQAEREREQQMEDSAPTAAPTQAPTTAATTKLRYQNFV